MFFGLTNSPAMFQMMINTIFRKEVAKGWLLVYMDDIAIHSKKRPLEMEEQHRQRHKLYIHHVLDKLEKHDLYLKLEKCAFEKDEIYYLRVIISNGIVKMDPLKLKGVAVSPRMGTLVSEQGVKAAFGLDMEGKGEISGLLQPSSGSKG